jgi:16S rRNA G966 N2-methylase RsmD
MPEGYYSSGPNPNLRQFVEEHSKPYDPLTDRYKVKPFDQPITTTKATAIYNMHSYHQGKKPHDAIRQYIRHYTKSEDLILDPFSGSGSTSLAALMEGRSMIAIDLSPAATFITKSYCTPVATDELTRVFEELKTEVEPEMRWLYETRCDRCDGRATTAFTVYSFVFQCPRCLEKFPLFDCAEAQGETLAGKPKTISTCPYCNARGISEEISTHSQRFAPVPVLVNYLCEEGCKPQRGERRHNDSNPKKRQFFELYDLTKVHQIESKEIPYPYPHHRMMNVEANKGTWGDKWRAGTSNFRTVEELYTKRNLWAIALWLNAAKDDRIKFAISSLLLGLSKMCRYDPNWSFPFPIMSGTYYLPQISKEMNAFLGVCSKTKNTLSRGWEAIRNETTLIKTANLLISTQSCTSIPALKANSIDYIFTDPPYGANVQYGELNFVWEAWLGFDTHWHKDEIIVNVTRDKTDEDWAELMKQAMNECYRVLKPGRWISMCYHDTSEGTWQLLQDLMSENGFIPEKTNNSLFIDTGGTTYNQITAEKVTKRDLVINFRKPYPNEISGQMVLFDENDFTTFQEAAHLILAETLTAHPGSSADRLYDELVSRTVRKGQFERHDFDALIRSVAEESPAGSGRWYLLATAGQIDEAESAKEESAAAWLESFMQKVLKENSSESGVHYSDLFEQYLPLTDKPRRLLQDWLSEFFYKTAEGTWRPSQTDEERLQKTALRSSGALRRIKRFANALLEGVPPYVKDQPENPATLADWIRQCRRAGLNELGKALYEKGGLRFDGLDEAARLELEEDYQVCVRRSEKPAQNKKPRKPVQEALDLEL